MEQENRTPLRREPAFTSMAASIQSFVMLVRPSSVLSTKRLTISPSSNTSWFFRQYCLPGTLRSQALQESKFKLRTALPKQGAAYVTLCRRIQQSTP